MSNFTKDDLKTGMIVQTKGGLKFLVLKGKFDTRRYGGQELIFVRNEDFMVGGSFTHSLCCPSSDTCNIDKVYKIYTSDLSNMLSGDDSLIWERLPLKITLQQKIEELQDELYLIKAKLDAC